MASISLRSLSKVYANGVTAVRCINLEIASGERVALVGPSGCGKSTTLRLIAGLEYPTSGDIYLADQPAQNVPPRRRDIAMVFQDDALYPHMTVWNNLAFGLQMRKVSRAEIERRTADVAKLLSLEDLLQYKPSTLSGGQRQRVALGRAVVRNPRIFLFDEPLSSLDAHQREGLRSEIIQLHQRSGKTMVYVTHDQAEAMSIGNRVAVMNRGVVEQVAAPMELYHRPANRFVAGFIGSPAMTFLDGRIDDGVFRWHQSSLNVGDRAGQGPMTLGVRPEDWIVDTSGSPFVEARVESVQRLGPETLVQLNLNEVTAHVRLDPRCEVKVHDLLPLSIRQKHWHWFAPDGQHERTGP